jgi:hypothetical protein
MKRQSGRFLVKGWIATFDEKEQLDYGRSFIYQLVTSSWQKFYLDSYHLPKLTKAFKKQKLDITLITLADCLGTTASKLSVIEAGYLIGAIYTATLPEKMRSEKGVYFQPRPFHLS